MLRAFMVATFTLTAQWALASGLWFGADHAQYEKNEYCSYEITVPVIKLRNNKSLSKGLKRLNQQWQDTMTSAIDEFNQAIRETGACSDFSFSYQSNYDFNLTTSLTAAVTSIETTYYFYTGGAHGYGGTEAVTFVSQTGERISDLSQILKDENLEKVIAIVENSLIEQELDFEFGWNEVKKSWTSMGQITNFHLNQNAIVIKFDPYEVGPYAAGPVSIELNSWELEDFSFQNSKVAQLVKKQLLK